MFLGRHIFQSQLRVNVWVGTHVPTQWNIPETWLDRLHPNGSNHRAHVSSFHSESREDRKRTRRSHHLYRVHRLVSEWAVPPCLSHVFGLNNSIRFLHSLRIRALNHIGVLRVRTPAMEGPTPPQGFLGFILFPPLLPGSTRRPETSDSSQCETGRLRPTRARKVRRTPAPRAQSRPLPIWEIEAANSQKEPLLDMFFQVGL